LIIPVFAILILILSGGGISFQIEESTSSYSLGGMRGIVMATALMLVFKQRYPRWWFDFSRELVCFSVRIAAYLFLLTDQYPSTVDQQAVHLEIDYPDAKRDLNRWLPLVKWLLAIPYYLVLAVLMFMGLFAVVYAWFSILLTGRYPRVLFHFVVGVGRWCLRVPGVCISTGY
jgi:hypothetical protein